MTARRDERGASLLMALAFLTLFGVAASVLLGFAGASMRTTVEVGDQRGILYAGDGGVELGIASVRRDLAQGRDPADGGTCTPPALPPIDGHTVTVTCTGQAGSGSVIPGVNAPRHAILSLSADAAAEDGLRVSGSSTLDAQGAVFSHSDIQITDTGGRLRTDGPVTARAACDPAKILATPTDCSIGSLAVADAVDPGYAPPLTTRPVLRAVPACPGQNRLVALDPGFYADATALSTLTNGGCRRTLLWLRPGVYYLDFDVNAGANTTWLVNDATVDVVAGTPQGWSPSGRPSVPAPGGCVDSGGADGAVLVFAGGSRLQVDRGTVQLCPPSPSNAQQISVYGLTADAAPLTTTLWSRAATASQINEPGKSNVAYTSRNFARIINETPARRYSTATLRNLNPPVQTVAIVQLSNFAALAPPVGTVTARVRVQHRESVPGNVDSITVTAFPGGGAAPCVGTIPPAAVDTVHDVDVTACADTAAKRTGLRVQFRIAVKSNSLVTETLDGMELGLDVTTPSLRAQRGCSVQPGGCAVLQAGAAGSLFVEGTVYAPLASLQADFGGRTATRFDRGVIVRAVLSSNAPDGDTEGRFRLPAARQVEFVAEVDGTPRTRARVEFRDSPVAGQSARVEDWEVLR